jgi:hypothetical protein
MFPKIEKHQYFVSFAELNTGIVLDINGDYYSNDNKNVFFIFNDYYEAKQFVNVRIQERQDWEGYIYDFNEKFIYKLDKFKEIDKKNAL